MAKQRTRILAWITSLMMLLSLFEGLALYPAWADTKTDVWDGTADTTWYNTTETSFTLTTPAQLAGFANLVNTDADTFEGKTISLGADIYLNADNSTAQEWTPIGQYVTVGGARTSSSDGAIISHLFKGTFDGCGHYVRNLYVDHSTATDDTCENNGLFAMNYGVIENVGVTGEVKTYRCGGGIAGYNEGTVRNCYGGCDISANGGGGSRGSGGVVGRNCGTVEFCWSDATVYNAYRAAGGVVGNNNGRDVDRDTGEIYSEAGRISGCWFTGSANSAGKTTKGSITAANDIENGAVVENCYFLKDSSGNGLGIGTYNTAETQEGTFEFGTDGKLTSDSTKTVIAELSALKDVVVPGDVSVTGSENYPMLSWQAAGDLDNTGGPSLNVIEGDHQTQVSASDIAEMAGEETTKSFTGKNGTSEVTARFTAVKAILEKAGIDTTKLESPIVLEAADGFSAEATTEQLDELYVYQQEDGTWRSALNGSAGRMWVSNLASVKVTVTEEAPSINVVNGVETTPVTAAEIAEMAGEETTKSFTGKNGTSEVTARFTAVKAILEKAGIDTTKLESPIVLEAADGFSAEATTEQLDELYVYQQEDGTWRSALNGSAGRMWVSNLASVKVTVTEEAPSINVVNGEDTTPVTAADIAEMAEEETTKSFTGKNGTSEVTARFTAVKAILEKAGIDTTKLESPIVLEAADGFSAEATTEQLDELYVYQQEDGTWRSALNGSAGRMWVSNLAKVKVTLKAEEATLTVIEGENETEITAAEIAEMAGAETTKKYTHKNNEIEVTTQFTALTDILKKAGIDASKLESPIVLLARDGFSAELTLEQLDEAYIYRQEDGTLRSAIDGSAGKLWVSDLISVTVTLKKTPVVPSGGGSTATPKYEIKTEAENGTITADAKTAAKGKTITLTVTAENGYKLDALSAVAADGKEVALTEKEKGSYTFVMPGSNVTVTGTFSEEEKGNLILTPNSTTGGTVSVDRERAESGEIVTVTVKPDAGYVPGEITAKDKDGQAIAVQKGQDDTYSFTMPDSQVVVNAYFEEEKSGDENCPSKKFSDLDTSLWYHEAVDFVLNNGIFNGTGAMLFEPDGDMTRAMFVTVLSRVAGIDAAQYTGSDFSDVAAGQWYSAAVQWASKNGIVEGTGNGRFEPNGSVTREQMATILYRYAKYRNVSTSGADAGKLSSFTDAGNVSDWAKDAVSWAVSIGLMNGMGNNMLEPQGVSTRAQVAQVIKNTFDRFVK